MSAPLDFMRTPENDRLSLIKERIPFSFNVPVSVAGLSETLSQLPEVDSASGMEIPPVPAALENRSAGEIYTRSSEDAAGAWQRLVVFTYRRGGRIHYRKKGSDSVLDRYNVIDESDLANAVSKRFNVQTTDRQKNPTERQQ